MRVALAFTALFLLVLVSSVLAAVGMIAALVWLLERGGWFA